jgi:hypothetical protein
MSSRLNLYSRTPVDAFLLKAGSWFRYKKTTPGVLNYVSKSDLQTIFYIIPFL